MKKILCIIGTRPEAIKMIPVIYALRSVPDFDCRIIATAQIVYPVHPNPNIEPVAHEMLGNHARIILCKPLDYISFLNMMKMAYLIMSDSGGIQEEAIALGKPVLLFRKQTER